MEFIVQVILSFFIGGAYVSLIIRVSERLGPRLGGAIAGIPTTILVSLAFLSITEGPSATRLATTIIPVMIIAALLYGWIFVWIAGKKKSTFGNYLALFGACAGWLVIAFIIKLFFSGVSFVTPVLVALIGCCLSYWLFRRFPSIETKPVTNRRRIYLVRFLAAGIVIANAVVAGRFLGPIWGGVVSSFPATIATTMYFLNLSQGLVFTKSFLRRLPFAFISTLVFVVILYLTLLELPALLSFIVSIIGSLLYTYGLTSIKISEASHNLK